MKLRLLIDNARGLSLIELLVIVVVIGIITAVAMQSMTANVDDMRRNNTMREMDMLAAAIVGDPSLTSGSTRNDFGYVGDIGAFPPDLAALQSNPGGYTTWDGPYLLPGFAQDTVGFRIDEWGKAYTYSGGTTITSTGSGTPITRDIARAQADYLANSFAGIVKDSDDQPPGNEYRDSVTVSLTYPNGSGSMTIASAATDSAGGFAFSGLPVGLHTMHIVFEPAADTLTRYVTITPRHRTDPPARFRFASAHFDNGGGASNSPGVGGSELSERSLR